MGQADLPDAAQYFHAWGLTPARLKPARPDAIVMHPQPMNRGIEIAARGGRRPAVGHPRPGAQWRRGAHGGACRGARARGEPAHERSSARGTIFLESGRVLSQLAFDAEQYVLRLQCAAKCAAQRATGQLRAPAPAIRPSPCAARCRSCARIRTKAGSRSSTRWWGLALQALAARQAGDELSVLGPIGKAFVPHRDRPRTLLDRRGRRHPADGVPGGTPARAARVQAPGPHGLGSPVPVPHAALDADPGAGHAGRRSIACMPLLEEWGVPSRLASRSEFAGCYRRVRDRAGRRWLAALGERELARSRSSPAARRRCCKPPRASPGASRCPARSRSRNSWRVRSGLRRLHGRGAHTRGPRDEARLRRWSGVRCLQRVLNPPRALIKHRGPSREGCP